jgi:hypothetical protein
MHAMQSDASIRPYVHTHTQNKTQTHTHLHTHTKHVCTRQNITQTHAENMSSKHNDIIPKVWLAAQHRL